jgi:hypothetical protein
LPEEPLETTLFFPLSRFSDVKASKSRPSSIFLS